ncbi:MAG TPA: DUF2239 family protein [Coriobacteriia bacterium]|nr:DUF2239 family protein [Coriobacteriia bacterium]
MNEHASPSYIAFAGSRRVARGELRDVAAAAKSVSASGENEPLLVFEVESSQQVELDLRGSLEDVLGRLPEAEACESSAESTAEEPGSGARKPGRPKLGVVAREITLLPRHWEWLAGQPGGASVTLRKLVEKARLAGADEDRIRLARDATYRFMFALAGDEQGFEDASRALFAGDSDGFLANTESWPSDVREHARGLAESSFAHEMGRD